jgi:hypothetical protein
MGKIQHIGFFNNLICYKICWLEFYNVSYEIFAKFTNKFQNEYNEIIHNFNSYYVLIKITL